MGQVTSLLSAVGQGQRNARGQLHPQLDPELRRLERSVARRTQAGRAFAVVTGNEHQFRRVPGLLVET